jgi:peptidoglycan/LPS O-acetylase OafA/YrhL
MGAMTADSPATTAASRSDSLDAVKGMLVMTMVVYHTLSIASTGGVETFRFIRFVSGSFIFLAGFVAARYMTDRMRRDPSAATWQLCARGAKIVALFTALNLAIAFSGFGNASKQPLIAAEFLRWAPEIYLAGNSRMTSFAILLPIGYLLVCAPVVLFAFVRAPLYAPLALLVAMLAASLHPTLAEQRPNVEFMLIGLAGMALGAPEVRAFERGAPGLLIVALGLTAAILLTGLFGSSDAAYLAGVAAIVRLAHDGARLADANAAVMRQLVRLGRYSLIAYIGQIALIQIVFRLTGAQRWAVGWEVAAIGTFAAVSVLVLCALVERGRQASPVVDKAYRLVFA